MQVNREDLLVSAGYADVILKTTENDRSRSYSLAPPDGDREGFLVKKRLSFDHVIISSLVCFFASSKTKNHASVINVMTQI